MVWDNTRQLQVRKKNQGVMMNIWRVSTVEHYHELRNIGVIQSSLDIRIHCSRNNYHHHLIHADLHNITTHYVFTFKTYIIFTWKSLIEKEEKLTQNYTVWTHRYKAYFPNIYVTNHYLDLSLVIQQTKYKEPDAKQTNETFV